MIKLLHSLTLAGGLAVLCGYSGMTNLQQSPQKTAASSVTTMTVSGCTFTVTYTWSGLRGRDLIATFGLSERKAGLDMSFNLVNIEGQVGKSGTLTHTFTLNANASAGRNIVARGELVENKKYTQISGSASASPNVVYSTCG